MTMYVYDLDTKILIKEINGNDNKNCESKATEQGFDDFDRFGWTYDAAFGFSFGLKKQSVQRVGDGQLICSDHWAKEFDKPEPETGWIAGKCDFCARSKAAAYLGKKGGLSRSDKKRAASAENGKKGGRPRNIAK